MSNSNDSCGKATFDWDVNHSKLGVDITSLSEGATFTEGDLVRFNANVNITNDYEYDWSWSTNYACAGAGSITGLGTYLLCPGNHTITAEAKVPAMNTTCPDQVSIQMKNRVPEIANTSTPPETIQKGTSLSIEGKAEDKSCERTLE